jgi:RNA polymerase sigma-70 factor (ECF subfamily)
VLPACRPACCDLCELHRAGLAERESPAEVIFAGGPRSAILAAVRGSLFRSWPRRQQPSAASEHLLVERLRRRDEQAFAQLVDLYGASMLRVARSFVPTTAAAEEVVQEAWLGVLGGIDRFEERSSLKTWLFRIVVNTARTKGVRESRSVPFSALAREPTVEPERFLGPDDPDHPGAWATPPHEWPASRLEQRETRDVIDGTIAELPPLQRQVITLRDIEGWTAEETCNALELTETNQRVLLHRARARVRRALEDYFNPA